MIRSIKRYSEWKDTALALHLLLQMMGKVKLRRMHPQPEWNQVLLAITPGGFRTGLMPGANGSFEIEMDVRTRRVDARCSSGLSAGFALREQGSVAGYYAQFMEMLAHIGHGTTVNLTPQEMRITQPFDEQTSVTPWDHDAAVAYHDACLFAHNALLTFASPYRGKKILPQLFWGTFDMTTVLFAGVDKPFPGKGLIERVAFDEQFVEFGFWPGDDAVDEPMFFVLPYPFLEKDLSGETITPKGAYYSPEKKEFFVPLMAILAEKDPAEALIAFCQQAFDAISRIEKWPEVPLRGRQKS